MPHLEIQVIGGLVQEQQVRSCSHERREDEPRALATGEGRKWLEHPITAESEPTQMITLRPTK